MITWIVSIVAKLGHKHSVKCVHGHQKIEYFCVTFDPKN